MNNSFSLESDISQEKPDERLQEREARLVRLVEAIEALSVDKNWSTLKETLFDVSLESIEKRMRTESEKSELNLPEIYRLQGERKVSKRFQLDVLRDNYRAELAQIRKTLLMNPPTSAGIG